MVLRCYFLSQQLYSIPLAPLSDLASWKLAWTNQSSCLCMPPQPPDMDMIILHMVYSSMSPLIWMTLLFGYSNQKVHVFGLHTNTPKYRTVYLTKFKIRGYCDISFKIAISSIIHMFFHTVPSYWNLLMNIVFWIKSSFPLWLKIEKSCATPWYFFFIKLFRSVKVLDYFRTGYNPRINSLIIS